jgi:cytoskeletal protein CcmA (bactofilin family)
MWMKRRGKVRGLGAFLDENSEIEGKYTCAGTVMVEARITGEVLSKDTLIVTERAVVHAIVRTGSLVVHGEVVGNVTATERVELRGKGRVTGDIEAPVIIMEEGTVHDGHCRMTKAEAGVEPLGVVLPMKA